MAWPSNKSYRPSVCVLEDRTVPTAFRTFPAGPATHLVVIAPAQVQAGQSFTVEVEAESAANAVATSFTGSVQLSLGTTDAGATLPAYTFTAADGGVHFFQVTLTVAGSQTVGAHATANAAIAGSAKTTVKPGALSQFQVTASSMVPVGKATSIRVAAEDAYGNVVTTFAGAVRLSAANANLPASYTFVAGDHGQHAFNVTFTAAGSDTVSATDAANSAITGQASLSAYVAGQATHFSVTVEGSVIAGVPTLVEVTALDAGNQVASSYRGIVHFTSTDAYASLVNDYAFTSSDAGSHLFSVIFAGPGTESFTATDTATSSITGVASVVVTPMSTADYGYPNYYGSSYYAYPNYYGSSYYAYPSYYGTGYYGNLGYYGSLGSYSIPSYYGTGWNWY